MLLVENLLVLGTSLFEKMIAFCSEVSVVIKMLNLLISSTFVRVIAVAVELFALGKFVVDCKQVKTNAIR